VISPLQHDVSVWAPPERPIWTSALDLEQRAHQTQGENATFIPRNETGGKGQDAYNEETQQGDVEMQEDPVGAQRLNGVTVEQHDQETLQ